MGSVLYSAIPPTSTLYARVQKEKAFTTLIVSLFDYGCGIFCFFEIEPDEVEEILGWVMEAHQDTLGSESEAKRWIGEFRAELERTRNLYPGIEDRTAFIEKCSDEIEKRLLQKLREKQGEDASELVSKLMFGEQTLAPHLLPADDSLELVSLSLVQEGAKILREITPEMLFARDQGWEEWCLENFEEWRNLYIEAAEKSEEILVGYG